MVQRRMALVVIVRTKGTSMELGQISVFIVGRQELGHVVIVQQKSMRSK